ncbi:MAG: coproporphyrinogen III oxidase family protein [Acidobacteria bacterium]|nr:coproporphyrinogen III oxidase family protein [Acidobacteriota bacterium]
MPGDRSDLGPVSGPGAGLYVHLPFCASRCSYCTFVVTTGRAFIEPYVDALRQESTLIDLDAGTILETLYFGGGTPSQIPLPLFVKIASFLTTRYPLAAGVEFTAEANPEDISPRLLNGWAGVGVNRLSMGIQSFVPEELELLDRRHTAPTAERVLEMTLNDGRFQVNADLMLAIPQQTVESLRVSVDTILRYRPHHVSIYLLEMDKPHRLRTFASRHPEAFPSDEQAASLYLLVHDWLTEAGYLHYEISNFALPGCIARHNVRYWRSEPVHALGVAAHGLDGPKHWANIDNLHGYLLALSRGTRPLAWSTSLSPRDELAQEIMLRLRLAEGAPHALVAEAQNVLPAFREKLNEFIDLGLAIADEAGRIHLSPRGWLLSNELFQELV